MRIERCFAAIAALAISLFGNAASAQDLRPIAGSRVAIGVPAQFSATDRFAGFIDEKTNASIVVMDMPAAGFEQIAGSLSPEVLATRGITNAKRGTLSGRADPYVYFTGEQASPIGKITKFLMVAQQGPNAAMITVNVPADAIDKNGLTVPAIEAMLAKVDIRAEPAAAQTPFRLGYLGPLKDAGAVGGAGRIYTLDGTGAPATPMPGRTLFIVVPSLNPTPAGDLGALADRAIKEIGDTSDVSVTARRSVTIAGLQGFEHLATARTGKGTVEIVLIQVVLAHPKGGYIRIVGQASGDGRQAILAEFQKIARSFSLAP